MSRGDGSEARLLALSDRELRLICSEATHQHYKGGLYRLRDLNVVSSADDGLPLKGKDDSAAVLYEHVYPYAPRFWLRDRSEFFGLVPDPDGSGGLIRRFRPLS